MNEKFSVELELVTKKIDRKISNLKQKLDNLGKSTEVKTPEVLGSFVGSDGKLYNYVRKTQEELEKTKEDEKDLNDEGEKTKIKFGDIFDKGVNSIKKFTLALVSVRSIFAIVSRASSAYLSQDTELANKLQSAWIGLGSVFAPIIEKIADFAIRVVAYVNYFIKALTGVDMLAKATTKSMNSANKSAKATAKTLAGFDEITNLNSSSGGLAGGSDVKDWADEFNNIKLNTNITSFLDKLATKLKNIYDEVLKPAFKWIKENPEWAATIAAGILLISSAISGGTGCLVVAIAALVTELGLAYKEEKKLNSQIKETTDLIKNDNKLTKENVKIWVERAKAGELTADQEKILSNWLIKNIKNTNAVTESLEKENKNLTLTQVNRLKNNEAIKSNNELIKENIAQLKMMYEAGKLDQQQTLDYIDVLKTYKKTLEDEKTTIQKQTGEYRTKLKALEENENAIKDVEKEIKNLNNLTATINIKTDTDTKPAKTKLQKFFEGLNKMGVFTTLFPGIGTVKNVLTKLASLDTGTNYVPNDQLAMIHKGEAVIPKKFNSSEYFGSGNSVTNALLEQLINVVSEKDMNTYLDGKEIGKSTVNYINSQSRIYGRSVIN